MTTPLDRDEIHRRLRAAHDALGVGECIDDGPADTAIKAARKAIFGIILALELNDRRGSQQNAESSEPKP